MKDGDAKRLIDFAAGMVLMGRGSIERVSNKTFVLLPEEPVGPDPSASLTDAAT